MLTATQLAYVAMIGALALAPGRRAQAQPEPQTLRLGATVDNLTILHDGFGHYFALEDSGDSNVFYYGDGKTFYRQVVNVFSNDPIQRSYGFWAPNVAVAGRQGGLLSKDKLGQWSVTCRGDATSLEVLSQQTRDELLDGATFKAAKWQRQIRFAARDEEGRYYIVDSERDNYEKGWRVFVGKRGKLRELPLLDIVSDSGGQVFATSIGDLSFERRKHRPVAEWSQGKRRLELTYVPPELNAQLFYVDMGIYRGGLGTPCDFF